MSTTEVYLQKLCFQYILPAVLFLIILKFVFRLFPRLKPSISACVINFLCTRVHRELVNRKTALFAELEKLKNDRPSASKDQPLNILEIGVGSGSNFKFYPDKSCIVGLDPNECFEQYIKERVAMCPGINFKEFVKGTAEDLSFIPNCTFDAVVSTYVMCHVHDVAASLSEVKRILKPGGKFLFIEHAAAHHGPWLVHRVVHHFLGHAHKGGNNHQNAGDHIEHAGFRRVNIEPFTLPRSWNLYKGLPANRPCIMGVATK